jgi:cytochrome c oxidase subunit 3
MSTTFVQDPAQTPPTPPGGVSVDALLKDKPRHSDASSSGIWVAIFAITMSFAALTSALIVRQGSGDWTHLVVPRLLYVNTAVLLFGSLTYELARRKGANGNAIEAGTSSGVLPWLAVTLALGLCFVAGQYLAWRQLAARGLFLATNPNSSFFYVFTGLHALHVIGGISALIYLVAKLSWGRCAARRSTFDGAAIYWHFMGGLWLYLLFVIRTRL